MRHPEKGSSMTQAWRMTLAILTCVVLTSGAFAADITASGCASAGVEAGCIMIESDGVIYDITAAQPKPEPGTFGTVKGLASDKMSICQQGKILDPAQWVPDPKQSCPK